MIDSRIAKPRVHLPAGSLVATTDALLRASEIPHERLLATGIRTPLGRGARGRLLRAGTIEVAGPSSAEDVRRVGEQMPRSAPSTCSSTARSIAAPHPRRRSPTAW